MSLQWSDDKPSRVGWAGLIFSLVLGAFLAGVIVGWLS